MINCSLNNEQTSLQIPESFVGGQHRFYELAWSIHEIISAGGKLQTVYSLCVVIIWNHLAITGELYGYGCMKIGNNKLHLELLIPRSRRDETWKLGEQPAERNIYFRSGNCIKASYICSTCIINIILCKYTVYSGSNFTRRS